MYQVAAAAGQTSEAAQLSVAYSQAKQLTQLCTNDAFVQFFAAHTFAQVASRIQDPPSRLQSLTDATRALYRYEALDLASVGGPVFQSGLTYENGTEAVVDTEISAKQLLWDIIVPQVVDLEARGQFHEFVSVGGRAKDAPCPYTAKGHAEAEAAGYYDAFETIAYYFQVNGGAPNSRGAIERLDWLRKACPDANEAVTLELGRLGTQVAGWHEMLNDGPAAKKAAAEAIGWLNEYKAMVDENDPSNTALAHANLLLTRMRALTAE
ncbi:hypothetical protein [Hyphomonas sp.]|uniref:hypothetical protein n=1 Tax=Hyphomonas sp. TaxID=87 RepID=UPI003529BAC8